MQINNPKVLKHNLLNLIRSYRDSNGHLLIDDDFQQALDKAIDSYQLPVKTAETKTISILMSDLRGFTAMAEKYSPLIVIELLNRYFAKMSQIIDDYGGTIDKFMGDSIMVLFDTVGSQSDVIHKTLSCGINMQIAMNDINKISQSLGMANLYMGIGINTGEVVAGTLGSDVYREYTVIGDQVNLVSRVEAHSLRGQILLTENTFNLAKQFVEIGEVNEVHVKGKHLPIKMFELLAVTAPQRLEVPCREIRKSPRVEVDIPLSYNLLENNSINPKEYHGNIIDISYGGLFTATSQALELYSEIKMTISLSLMGKGSSQIYARVLNSNRVGDIFESHLEFTAIDEPAKMAIKTYVDELV